MAAKTRIAWTNSTWNPLRGTGGLWHCYHVSPGCDHCYAEALNRRRGGPAYQRGADTLRLDEKMLLQPLQWREPRMIFVCSMSDLFMSEVPSAWLDRIFDIMRQAPQHTYQLLTKRPARMAHYLCGPKLPANWWVGTTIESDNFCFRAGFLRMIDVPVRWISAEPLLGPLPNLDLKEIGWVVTGGESGANHRPFDPAWALDLRDRCRAAGIPFFHKQGSHYFSGQDRLLGGELIEEYPVTHVAQGQLALTGV